MYISTSVKKNCTFFGLSTACTTLCKIMTPQHFWGLNQRLDIISCQSLWKSKRFYAGPKTCPKCQAKRPSLAGWLRRPRSWNTNLHAPSKTFFQWNIFLNWAREKTDLHELKVHCTKWFDMEYFFEEEKKCVAIFQQKISKTPTFQL